MEEEVERPSAAGPSVHFTSTLPSAVCESPSDGDKVASPGISVGTAARTLGDCVGASKDSLLEELAELDGRESLDAIIHLGMMLISSVPMGWEVLIRTVLRADHDWVEYHKHEVQVVYAAVKCQP